MTPQQLRRIIAFPKQSTVSKEKLRSMCQKQGIRYRETDSKQILALKLLNKMAQISDFHLEEDEI